MVMLVIGLIIGFILGSFIMSAMAVNKINKLESAYYEEVRLNERLVNKVRNLEK